LIFTTSPRFSSTYGNKRGHGSKLKRFGCFTFGESRDVLLFVDGVCFSRKNFELNWVYKFFTFFHSFPVHSPFFPVLIERGMNGERKRNFLEMDALTVSREYHRSIHFKNDFFKIRKESRMPSLMQIMQ